MNLIESISSCLFDNKVEKNKVPEGVCPNCWGKQEYGNKVRILLEDKQVDVSNKNARHAFIKDFVVKNIDGIRLKKHNTNYECPTCKTSTPIN